MTHKILIAYFSRRGENYAFGKITYLEVGNTEKVAKYIKDAVGGDLFEIERLEPYPESYRATQIESQRELFMNLRPEPLKIPEDLASYDIIFLGYPNWWDKPPMVVMTFLDMLNSETKTIIPFATDEGSLIHDSVLALSEECPKAHFLYGLSVSGREVDNAREMFEEWAVNRLNEASMPGKN